MEKNKREVVWVGKLPKPNLHTIPVALADDEVHYVQEGDNANVAVIGPPGCGKTFSNLLPNLLLSTECSIIVDDKKGILYHKTKDYFREKGYRVLKFDMMHFDEKSIQYNPFHNIKNREDILRIVHMLIPKDLDMNPFWVTTARELAVCLIEIGIEEAKQSGEEFTMELFFELLHSVGRNPDEKDVIDLLIEEEKENGLHYRAMEDYEMLKRCAESTWLSIVVSLEGYMQRFRTAEDMDIFQRSSVELVSIGTEKTILYVISSDIDDSKYLFVQLLYQDILQQLLSYADKECIRREGRLPIPVRFLIDDFASGVQMHNFPNIIANCRSRNISFMLFFQSIAQLEGIYGKYAQSILDCMEYQVFYPSINISSTNYLCEAANLSREEVMEMDREQVCVLQRCKQAVIAYRNSVEGMPEYLLAYRCLREMNGKYDYMGQNGSEAYNTILVENDPGKGWLQVDGFRKGETKLWMPTNVYYNPWKILGKCIGDEFQLYLEDDGDNKRKKEENQLPEVLKNKVLIWKAHAAAVTKNRIFEWRIKYASLQFVFENRMYELYPSALATSQEVFEYIAGDMEQELRDMQCRYVKYMGMMD